jgi:hypothetical protein
MTNGGFSLSIGGLMPVLWLFLGIRRSSMKQLSQAPTGGRKASYRRRL